MKTYKIDILCHNNRVYRLIVDAESQESARREVISKAVSKNLWVQRVFVKSCMPKEDYGNLPSQRQNPQNESVDSKKPDNGSKEDGGESC
ncbi:MAG: hypothetical protein GY748_15855 [Planctomycetaceae bacterium]|nr:hypothetical protein [Planctomycetaceae bacterium]MCP4478912.1 hypothetical protein [Planctomycetaceae bacterium]